MPAASGLSAPGGQAISRPPRGESGDSMTRTATVFNIERFATEDGPGIRTVVFLKGCSLRCKWCANPESQHAEPQILHKAAVCTGCGRCVGLCPRQGIAPIEGMGLIAHPDLCTACGTCIDGCYYGARVRMGDDYPVERLLDEVSKDAEYFRGSGGGVTFSGGEPLLHADFIADFAVRAAANGIGTLIETCGQVPLASFRKVAGVADGIYYDFKHMDAERHRELTGADNRIIMENLVWLNAEYRGFLAVRYPYVPGMNDDPGAVEAFIDFVTTLENVNEIWFLPYHRLGLSKYQGLGLDYEMGNTAPLKVSDIEFLKKYQDRLSIPIRI